MVRVRFIMLVLLFVPLLSHCQQSTFYNVPCGQTIFGQPIDLKAYQGKLLLIVNTASSLPRYSEEMNQLRLLLKMYGDSAFIIMVFPSNSFGNESRTSSQLKTMFGEKEKIIVAAITAVTGPGLHPLYYWLAKKENNGKAAAAVKTDFQKFLIDKSGNLAGYFSGKMLPTDSSLLRAIDMHLH